jgi:hypothetical protein
MIFNNKYLKNTLFLLLLSLFSFGLKAQIKIGTNPEVVNKAAIFELESIDRGLLFPRVSLTNTTTWGLISGSTPVAGMVVYNVKTTTDGFVGSASYPASLPDGTGLYYWDGTGWLMMKGVNEKITDFSSSSTEPGIFTFTNELGAKTSIKITQSADGDPITNAVIGKAGDIYVDKLSGDIYTFNGTNWIKSNAVLSMDLASETTRATTAETALEANKEDKVNKSTDVNLADATNTKFPTELAVKTYVDAKSSALSADLLTETNRATTAETALEANKEDKVNKSTDVNLADATNTKFPTELAVKTYVDAKSSTLSADLLTETTRATTVEAALEANKEDKANKSTDVTLSDATNTKFPTVLAVKTYVDGQVSQATPNATSTNLGKIKLAGDLAGSNNANLPTITNDAITTDKIKDGEVQTADIKDGDVTSIKLAADAVETIKIKDLNVTTTKLADAAVTESKIKSGANNTVLVTDNSGAVAWINSSDFGAVADMTSIEGVGTTASPFKVKDLGIIAAKLDDGAVTTIKIADANVTNDKLAADAVSSAKILDATILVDDLANDAVETDKIKDLNITTSKIADANITNSKLENDAITTDKIKDGEVQTDDIKDANVTTLKIANANVTTAKIAPGSFNQVLITDGTGAVAWFDKNAFGAIADLTSIEGAGTTASPFKVKDLAITTAKIATDAVTTAQILNETILAEDLASNAVTNIKIADNAVTSAKILNGTIVNEDIADATITTAKISGTIAIAQGGTGATTAVGALTNLGAEAVANKSTAIDMDGVNADDVKYPTQLAVKTFVENSLNNGVGTATQTALNLKEDLSNKSTDVALGTSNQLYPSQNAVKSYVDTKLTTTNAISSLTYLPNISNNRILGNTSGATTTPQEIPVTGSGDVVLKTSAELNTPTITSPVLNGTISGSAIVPVKQGGSGADMSTTAGYVKQASEGANFSTVAKIPVADVDGAVRKVNGVEPDINGNVAVIIGRVFTGATVDPNLATSIINASPAKQQSDIYIVADGSNPNNGRTFIYDGTDWLEVATDLSTTDARYVNVAGDTMEGNLTAPTGIKIILEDAPSGSTDAVNKAYVDGLVTSSATPNATTSETGKIQLAGDLTGTATSPEIAANKVTFAKMQTVSSDVILGRSSAGTGNIEALTTLPVATLPALTGDITTSAGSAATTITNNAVTYAKIQDLSAQSLLLGSKSTGGTGLSEISLGTGLSMLNGTLSATGGTVTNISGTTDRITVTNGATTPSVDISANYVGQNSISTLGTITTGTWNGTTISVPNGGTGATTLTGYVIGNGTSAMSASATIPVADVTGAQTTANLSSNITTNTGSTSMYPSVAAVETYVSANATPDATTTAKGKIQLSGDLAGTADAPTVPGLLLKAPLASPALTGTPTAPTAAAGTNTTQLATTAFVSAASGTPFFKAGTTNDVLSDKTVNIYTNKNIGIGTNSPTTNLDVVGGFSLRNTAGAAGTGYGMEFNTNASSPRIDWVYNGNYTGSFAGDSDFFFRLQNSKVGAGGFRFLTNPSGTGLERFTILNNGNIGVGIANPTKLFHLYTANTASLLFESENAAGGQASIDFKVGNTSSYWRLIGQGTSNGSRFDIYNQKANSIVLSILSTNNNVGIGTITPAERLTVSGNVLADKLIKTGGTAAQFLKADGSVDNVVYAPLASPSLTGTPKSITPTAGDNSTNIATTAFVTSAISTAETPDATSTVKGKIQLAGDLSGTASAPSVVKIQGIAISAIAPTTNQLLQFDGTEWKPVSKSAIVSMETEEFTPTASQTNFTLTNTPLGKVAMFINGSRVPKAAITISGTTITYVSANNDAYALLTTDRVSFDYVY